MSFAGFDLDRTDALARALRDACDQAARLSREIAGTLDEAHELIATADGGSARGPWSTDHDAARVGLSTVRSEGYPRAGQLERRAAHLRASDELSREGFWVDPTRAFDDAPPPDQAAIRRVLAELRAASGDDTGWSGNHDELTAAFEHLRELSAAELDAVLLGLTDEEYARLDTAMRRGDSLFNESDGLSNDELVRLGNDILPRASAAAVRRLSTGLPVLQPSFGDLEPAISGNYSWAGPIDIDEAVLDDINQGVVGDCWFLAALGAELQADPSFVADHVKDNGNGTWTVTFYRDGKPVPVTVDSSVAFTEDISTPSGRSPLAARGSGEERSPNWVSIYEKAFARFNGSYGEIERGVGAQAMEALTGRDADQREDWFVLDVPPLAEVKEMFDAGHPITVGTKSDWAMWPFGEGDSDGLIFNEQLVSRHAYTVTNVEDTDQGLRITVRNPWGNYARDLEEIVLDEESYHRSFWEVSVG